MDGEVIVFYLAVHGFQAVDDTISVQVSPAPPPGMAVPDVLVHCGIRPGFSSGGIPRYRGRDQLRDL
jgi:hypothetical protein